MCSGCRDTGKGKSTGDVGKADVGWSDLGWRPGFTPVLAV